MSTDPSPPYPALFAAFAVLALVLTGLFLGLGQFGMGIPLQGAVFPLPTALLMARRMPWGAYGLLPVAALAAAIGGYGPLDGALFGGITATGIVLGRSLALGRPYGVVLTQVTLALTIVTSAGLMFHWDAWRAQAIDARHEAEEQLEAIQGASEPSQREEARIELVVWLYGHWDAIGLGLAGAAVVLASFGMLALVAFWLGLTREARPPGERLRDIRPPDALVWPVIGAGLLWLAHARWPDAGFHVYSWNALIVLSAIYWLNGLLITIHALCVYKVRPFVRALLFVAMAYLGALPALAPVGLFDTWLDFRGRIDQAAAARDGAQSGGGGQDGGS